MIEVRCCCQPRKLLGYMNIPMPKTQYVVFPLAPRPGDMGFSSLQLPLAVFVDERGNRHKAFKSEETPIEVLRRVGCFIEVQP